MDDDERLAAGVLWPGFFGTEPPRWLRERLRAGLAGVVYFGQNLGGDVAALSAAIRAENPRALIGIDEEGGSVTRLETETGSTLPGAAQLGIVDDLRATRATGAELARRLRAVGADVLLGPVADVNTDPRNPVIGVRSFGDDAALVSRHVAAEVEGVQRGGVAACVKHFPGHGDTHLDSHHALPVVGADAAEMDRVHLAPFRAAVEAGVDAVMTAHIVVPAWGEEPATLNPRVLGLLRAMGFEGVIITDALDMAAIRESVGIGGGAVRALAAGADLLCIGNPTNPGDAAAADQDEQDFLAAFGAVVAALRDGSLPRERVSEAAERVAWLAERLATASAADASSAPADAGLFADVVDRSLVVRGELGAKAAGLAVIDARRASSLAVDSGAAYAGEELAVDGWRERIDPARASASERAETIGRARAAAQERGLRVAVLVDAIATGGPQRTLCEEVAVAVPDAVIVDVGIAAQDETGALPVVEVHATSRIGSARARALLATTTS
ncbi:glycoside hydrolase family 3 protein [Microbacterium pseudoresistens]|uniref:Beta-N-acetylhexosaminidase n=1 Tax=Microbacterium pseudoresistens TaxID=640634 RepID=A0A7Y9ET56_9MICO|nr:glycoside hydrolase family 3 N-terminal domain-containing protein [Microbacterium pseudoresistens]NYD53488.1 beta-N-acetylhexosaminidase [Microbacterium pseudoresistens]